MRLRVLVIPKTLQGRKSHTHDLKQLEEVAGRGQEAATRFWQCEKKSIYIYIYTYIDIYIYRCKVETSVIPGRNKSVKVCLARYLQTTAWCGRHIWIQSMNKPYHNVYGRRSSLFSEKVSVYRLIDNLHWTGKCSKVCFTQTKQVWVSMCSKSRLRHVLVF